MASIQELIGFVAEKNPTDFFETYSQILGERAVEAVGEKKKQIAESLFGLAEETEEAEEVSEESEETEDESEEDA